MQESMDSVLICIRWKKNLRLG